MHWACAIVCINGETCMYWEEIMIFDCSRHWDNILTEANHWWMVLYNSWPHPPATPLFWLPKFSEVSNFINRYTLDTPHTTSMRRWPDAYHLLSKMCVVCHNVLPPVETCTCSYMYMYSHDTYTHTHTHTHKYTSTHHTHHVHTHTHIMYTHTFTHTLDTFASVSNQQFHLAAWILFWIIVSMSASVLGWYHNGSVGPHTRALHSRRQGFPVLGQLVLRSCSQTIKTE